MEPQKTIVLPIVLSILGTAVVAGGAAYYFGTNQSSNQPTTVATIAPKVAVTPTSIVSMSPTPTSQAPTVTSDITQWKEFQLPDAKVSFKYPPEWGNITVQHGSARKGTSPHISFSGTPVISAGTISKDLDAPRGALDHESVVSAITSANNNCQKIELFSPSKLVCSKVTTGSGTAAYFIGNLGDHDPIPHPGIAEVLVGYAQYPSSYNFTDFVFLSTDTNSASEELIKQLLSTIKFL